MENKKIILDENQKKAVNIDKNISVSAGAGSGKTRVLTVRFMNLLEAGIDIEQIVAITFTDKASLEMKQRVRENILKELEDSPTERKKFYQRSLDKLNKANISTIHSFCAKILRENAALVGIDFNFDIINELDKLEFLYAAINRIIAEKLKIDEFKIISENLKDVYGEEYLDGQFINDIMDIRKSILDKDGDFKTMLNNACDDMQIFISSILVELQEEYLKYKRERDLLDYNDLETICYELLQNKNINERYKKRFKRFLVDEFQDTNEIQKKIIYSLVMEDNEIIPKSLFIVGDFKQSIYGFRGTNYKIFSEVSERIGKSNKVLLNTCYRSENEVIHGVNCLFKNLIENYEMLKPSKERGDKKKRIFYLSYDDQNRDNKNEKALVKSFIKEKKENVEEFKRLLTDLRESFDTAKICEDEKTVAVIKAISHLKNNGLDYKDMCILVRSKFIISDIETSLKKRNIHYCIIGGRGFYDKEEVKGVLLLFEIVNKNFQKEYTSMENLKVLELLRSYIFNIPDDILYNIMLEMKEVPHLKNYIEASEFYLDGMKDGENKTALERAITLIKKLNRLTERFTAIKLLEYIVKLCSIKELLLNLEDGVQKYRNIEKLLREAEKYDKEEMFTAQGFLEYLKVLEENNIEDAEAVLDTENSEAIKIMTIHQSKGLEFKGVIIPNIDNNYLKKTIETEKKKNLVYYNNEIISRNELNEGKDSESYQTYLEEKFKSVEEEEKRVLYVAMTRAKKYIVLVGKELKDAKTENTYSSLIRASNEVSENKYIECIKASEINDFYESVIDNKDYVDEYKKLKAIIEFNSTYKPRSVISASAYMKYINCPRRYYVERVYKIDPNSYIDKEQKGNIMSESYEEEEKLQASVLGSLVHSIIEKIENGTMRTDEKLPKQVERYINNYKKIKATDLKGEKLIFSANELSFLNAPLPDRRMVVNGFIDRVEVFEDNGKYKAIIIDYKTNRIQGEKSIEHIKDIYTKQLYLYGKAIKENLRVNGRAIDEIKLKLYLLDACKVLEIPYKEEEVQKQLLDMDSVFSTSLNNLTINDFQNVTCKYCNCLNKCY